MKCLDSYNNMKLELNILTKRLEVVIEYEKKFSMEKEYLNNLIEYQLKILKQMEQDICDLSGIENKLYKEIVVNGISVSKAIEKVSEEEDKDVSTLWKNYYPSVKEKIEQLSKIDK